MPEPLLDDVAELLRDGDAPYSDRSDFIKGAVRKEVDYLRAKKADRILTSEG
jgi:Arc/MetJ-type ribon-helix-helix transcriptional regulator